MYIVAGLGNPGERYRNTRHNVGFWVVERLAPNLRWHQGFGCYYAKRAIAGAECILVLPQLYMNRSGEAIAQVLAYFKQEPSALIVVHDDVDLSVGSLQVRLGGSGAGHHGIENVIERLGSDAFYRVRVGIGRPEGCDVTHWVLGTPSAEELASLEEVGREAACAVETLVGEGLCVAQRRFNKRYGPPEGLAE